MGTPPKNRSGPESGIGLDGKFPPAPAVTPIAKLSAKSTTAAGNTLDGFDPFFDEPARGVAKPEFISHVQGSAPGRCLFVCGLLGSCWPFHFPDSPILSERTPDFPGAALPLGCPYNAYSFLQPSWVSFDKAMLIPIPFLQFCFPDSSPTRLLQIFCLHPAVWTLPFRPRCWCDLTSTPLYQLCYITVLFYSGHTTSTTLCEPCWTTLLHVLQLYICSSRNWVSDFDFLLITTNQ